MKLKQFEAVLLLVVMILFTYASAAGARQQMLADKMLRLHVLADSDGAEDQRVKLCVRDRVLAYCQPLLEKAETQQDVRQILGAHMQQIVNAAQLELWRQGTSDSVTAQLSEEYYPTRDYQDFSLPAGRYVGLRIKIGAAAGHNWWCVIFPPMCRGAASAQTDTLTEDERAFTRRDGTQYVVRFKAAELFGEFRHALGY